MTLCRGKKGEKNLIYSPLHKNRTEGGTGACKNRNF